MPPYTDAQRWEAFRAKYVVTAAGCWQWQGSRTRSSGYATFAVGRRRSVVAHKFAYERLVGPVPDGMQLDHLCHLWDTVCPGGPQCAHRSCVNPAHLEVTTGRTNTLRGRTIAARNAAKSHCKRGHALSGDNLYVPPPGARARGARTCRTCHRAASRRYKDKLRAA